MDGIFALIEIYVKIMVLIGVVIIFVILFKTALTPSNKTDSNNKAEPVRKKEYKPKSILTKNEWINYLGMREYAAAHGLIICPKIRLADLVEPVHGTRSEWQKRFNQIKAKHVDFVLCDPDMHVKVIVELDDSSHSRADRIKRDQFVDAALIGAGYKIVHIRKFDDAGVAALDTILDPKPTAPAQTEEAVIG